jgi:hypothetical protein
LSESSLLYHVVRTEESLNHTLEHFGINQDRY